MGQLARAAALLGLLALPAAASEKTATGIVDLAICLDTSSSMDGLIDSARQRIWAVVNDLALAKPTPRLRVALLTYGNTEHDAGAGWVRLESGFTEDLDAISARLGLETSGGHEYVGRVLQGALAQLQWQESKDALKILVVAGNESADQDRTVDYRLMCRNAIARGIMVNALYCGRASDIDAGSWREIARLSDGRFVAIDQNTRAMHVASPYDAALESLSGQVNKTYVPVGDRGRRAAKRQTREDGNAGRANSSTGADRAATKSSKLYYCSWDAVDLVLVRDQKLETIPDIDLPEAIRGLALEEKLDYLHKKLALRQDLQSQIQALHAKRRSYVTQQTSRKPASFDAAIRESIRTQAKSKGYSY